MKPALGYVILAVAVLAVVLGVVLVVTTRHAPSHERPAVTRRTCLGAPSYNTVAFDRASASSVLYRFIYDATFRQDPARAWGYATSTERQGMTLTQWATGTIPVVPEPIGVACTVGAKQYGPRKWMAVVKVSGTFYMGVVLRRGGHWLVDYFLPLPHVAAPQR